MVACELQGRFDMFLALNSRTASAPEVHSCTYNVNLIFNMHFVLRHSPRPVKIDYFFYVHLPCHISRTVQYFCTGLFLKGSARVGCRRALDNRSVSALEVLWKWRDSSRGGRIP